MRRASHLREPRWAQTLLIFGAFAYVAVMLVMPLGAVLSGLEKGFRNVDRAIPSPTRARQSG